MIAALRAALEQLGPGPLVVAVSGGADSLALLHALRMVAPAMGVALHVAHLGHGMRGAVGAADAVWVAAQAVAWGLPCTVRRADVPAYARQAGRSPEDAARAVRYTFLAGVAAQVGAQAVAVAHHADDQAETVLAHLLRGAGLPGLAGMAAWSPLPLPADAVALAAALDLPLPAVAPHLLRPWLGISRAAILAYCAAHRLTPREDASNSDPAHRRNYLRHTVLPLLDAAYPGVARRLATAAGVFAEENALLEAALDHAWPDLAAVQPGAVRLDRAALARLPAALRRRAIRRAVGALTGGTHDLAADHLAAALTLLGPAGRTGATLHLPGGVVLHRERDAGVLTRTDKPAADPRRPWRDPGTSLPLPVAGDVPVGGYLLRITHAPAGAVDPTTLGADPWTAVFDAATLAALGPLVLRTRRPGDRLAPFGAGGHSRKLQDLLVDGGVPRAARAGLPLLVAADGPLLWVPGPGGRRSGHALLTTASGMAVIFTFIPAPDAYQAGAPTVDE